MFKKIFSYIKPYKWKLIVAICCVVVESILEMFVPFLMNYIIQNGGGITYEPVTGEVLSINLNYTLLIGGLMIGAALIAFIIGIISSKMTAIVGRGLGAEIRKAEFKKVQEYSFNNLDSFRASSLITRLTNDVTIIQDSFCQSFRATLRAPTMLISSIVLAFIVNPFLGLIFLIIVPILGILLYFVVKKAAPKFVILQKIVDKLNRTTQESIIAIRTIKAYVKEDYEQEKFNNVNDELVKTSTSAFSTIALNMPIMQLMTYCCTICILLFGAYFFTEGLIRDVANITTFLTYINQLLASLNMLSNVLMNVNRASASVRRVYEVLNTDSEIIDNKNSHATINSGDVTFKNVYFKYKSDAENYVLNNINMDIKSGQFVGIIGQTGSSKTTLINVLERFYDITSGEILIDNKPIKDYSLEEIHRKIAISFQNPILFSGTVKENLLRGNKNATDEEIINACKIACCYDFIMNQLPNGFDTIIGQSGTNVSGGQRQRLCLARAILRDPKILILDDSFSALDRITEKTIKENLKNQLHDKTIIVISQKISSIQDADVIYVLNEGKINHYGNHNELMESDEIYRSIFTIQNEGGLR